MSELISAPEDPQDAVQAPEQVVEQVTQPLVVITEQAVAFSTAAAVPLPRTQPTRSWIAAFRAMFLSASEAARPSSSEDTRTAPRHYPSRRDAFLEDAAMAREMRRL